MAYINGENPKLREIKELEKRLAEKKAALGAESKKPESMEAEISIENVQEMQVPIVPASKKTVITDDEEKKLEEIKKDVRKIRDLDIMRQVKVLVTLAFEKGISYSIKVARGLDDAYLLDALHDQLIGELNEELIKKGRLRKI